MTPDSFAWLLTAPGQQLLARASGMLADGMAVLRVGERLRQDHDVDQVATALGQIDLRERARAKFGKQAESMYFTPDGLEQATRAPVSAHRAGRLSAAGPVSVLDLGCGIGGDLLAFARAGLTAAGIDRDELRVAVAAANLAALDLPGAVQVAEATTVALAGFDVVYADPGRRSGAGRTFDPESWEPPWSFVSGLLTRAACVKVAPGIPHHRIPEGVEAEWVSDRGELKEAALWSGPLATVARRATVIGDGGLATLTDEDDPGPAAAPVRAVGELLYEPDPAVIRAGLVTAVAFGVQGGLVDHHIAYVTSDDLFRTPFARGYRVLEELPYQEKLLKAALRQRRIGALTIKKRGVDIVPEQLRKRLGLSGGQAATLVLTRVAGKGTALLVEPA